MVIACHGEEVDACGLILDIDAVKECGILIVTGSIGGDIALNRELQSFLRSIDICNGSDVGFGNEHIYNVHYELIVAVL